MQAVSAFSDCRVKVTVERLYKKRSTKTFKDDGTEGRGQNGYYHTIIVPFFIEGYFNTHGKLITHDEAHEKLKFNCNYSEWWNESTGEVIHDAQSTAELTTVQFEEFTERCRQFIYEWFGMDVPLPNEQAELEFKV